MRERGGPWKGTGVWDHMGGHGERGHMERRQVWLAELVSLVEPLGATDGRGGWASRREEMHDPLLSPMVQCISFEKRRPILVSPIKSNGSSLEHGESQISPNLRMTYTEVAWISKMGRRRGV